MEFSLTTFDDAVGQTFILFSSRRIDDKKEEEIHLLKKYVELNKTIESKDYLFSVIGNELKNPLSSVINTAAIIEEHYNKMDNTELQKNLQRIISSADHLFKLFDNLMQWSKNSVGEIDYEPSIHKISDLVMDATEFLQHQAKYKNIKLKYNIDKHSAPFVVCDEKMIKSVIINLVSNAVKYSKHESQVEIIIENYEQDNLYLLISVRDNGVGIPPEQMPTLFSAKKNSATDGTDNERGIGLGLVLSYEFIKKHNCNIWAKSEPGVETTFSFTLLKK